MISVKLENGKIYRDKEHWYLGFKRRKRNLLCELHYPDRGMWDIDLHKEYYDLQKLLLDFYKRAYE